MGQIPQIDDLIIKLAALHEADRYEILELLGARERKRVEQLLSLPSRSVAPVRSPEPDYSRLGLSSWLLNQFAEKTEMSPRAWQRLSYHALALLADSKLPGEVLQNSDDGYSLADRFLNAFWRRREV
jgi:hypothetical protein